MPARTIARSLSWLALSATVVAQESTPDRSLTFGWPDAATVSVQSENWRSETGAKDRSFTLTYTVKVTKDGDALRVGRRAVAVSKWNGRDVPEKARPQLAPIELQTELLPDLVIAADGRCSGFEDPKAFLERAEKRIAARVEAGSVPERVAPQITASLTGRAATESLRVQAQKPWDEWIARWRDLNFAEDETADFAGEIELATGDLVDGKFTARHFGAMQDRDGHVRLRIDFEASGGRLDAAALKWRRMHFGGDEEQFEKISMSVRERTEAVMRPDTMQPAWVETERTTTVTVGKESKEIRERRRWTFTW